MSQLASESVLDELPAYLAQNVLDHFCSKSLLITVGHSRIEKKKETMRRFIIIFTFFIQSHYAAFVKWKGQDPLSVSVGGYSFFATNDNDIYKFDGTAVAKV